MDYGNTIPDDPPLGGALDANMTPNQVAKPGEQPETPNDVKALCAKLIRKIKTDKKYHDKAFTRMKRDMQIAMWGREKEWSDKNYTANIAGRHVKQKTATLYAKNPKATAKRKERLDFSVWDEDPQSLLLAFQTIQQGIIAAQMHAQGAVAPAPTGLPVPGAPQAPPGAPPVVPGAPPAAPPGMPSPADPLAAPTAQPQPPGALAGQTAAILGAKAPLQMPPGFAQAQAVVADFQQGMERRKLIDKIGSTLEILIANSMREPKPLDFKTGVKGVVRRTGATGVGYIELGFQREVGPRPGLAEQLSDARNRLDHLKRLAEEVHEGEITGDDAEMAELQLSVAALQAEPEIVLREGLLFDYPQSTKVIPDRMCKSLVGFVGARHLTVEYEYTIDEASELFPDVDFKKCASYSPDGKKIDDIAGEMFDEDGASWPTFRKGTGLCRVWKHYDKASGLIYYVADGYDEFLREPSAPEVFVEDFWPIYALTFNAAESESELFPPSDVSLILDMTREINRSRQGLREHRYAARPRWAYPNGALEEEDIDKITRAKPYDAIGLNVGAGTKMQDILQSFPVPGVDPNLYETNQFFTDIQLVVGTQQAQLGGLAKATATESAISAGASQTADGSSVDDLDAFLTVVMRASGQILLREISEQEVMKTVGPGAVWPQMSLSDIADELYLEVEAGSSGKPNQAVEMNNWKTMLPFLIQMGSIRPEWLARETLSRLDDRMDLTDAIAAGIPAIVAQNRMQQPGPANPGAAPDAQGGEGVNNAPRPAAAQPGSNPAFGSNQV